MDFAENETLAASAGRSLPAAPRSGDGLKSPLLQPTASEYCSFNSCGGPLTSVAGGHTFVSADAVRPAKGALSGLFDPKIERVLGVARTHLQMDVAVLSEFSAGSQVYRAVNGEADSFGISVGAGTDLVRNYCRLMVDGRIPNAMPDTGAQALVRELPVTPARGIGSYIGVPLRLSDGTLYGTLCCMSHTPEPIDARDAGFMAMLAEVLLEELDRQHQREQERAVISGILDAESIRIAFQPIVGLQHGRRFGVEALSRFPEGVGTDLEALAARRAISFLPRIPAGQYLAVKLSPTAVLELSDRFLDGACADLSRLVLEITETDAVGCYQGLRSCQVPLREQGLRLAIDDAGAGYSSLLHIVELLPEIIKIDKSLIGGIACGQGYLLGSRSKATGRPDGR